MLLVESDGKALFQSFGIATPSGFLVANPNAPVALMGSGPWVVKAQVPVGGRGKAGGIALCDSAAMVESELRRLLGTQIKGHEVHCCLVESAIVSAKEYYISLVVDPTNCGVRVTLLREGGMDVERAASRSGARSRLASLDRDEIIASISALAEEEAEVDGRAGIVELGTKLATLFVTHELILAEINPLFVKDGNCIAGDAKVVVDINAIERQPQIAALIERNRVAYPDAVRKLKDGFDYVEIDPNGEIGLITTGAGLSMMLVDELTARGARPLNFCDIRTGQFRGDPSRLIRVLGWIAARPSVRVVFINIFAGITDLSEFANLLCSALDRVPVGVPVVARLVGNRASDAYAILAARKPEITVEEALETALNRVGAILRKNRPC